MTEAETPRQDQDPVQDVEAAAQRRQAGLLVLLGVIGIVAVLPYGFALQADKLAEVTKQTGASLLSLALVSAAPSTIFVLIAVVAGLAAARRVGLHAPVTAALSRGEPVGPLLRSFLGPAVGTGLVFGAAVVLLDDQFFNLRVPELRALNQAAMAHHSLWKAALACLYGGFTEELLVRLFLMSVVALGLVHLGRVLGGGKVGPQGRWSALLAANVIAAVLFGLLHLPATAALVKLTPLLVLRAVVQNGLVGLACGFLFMRRGLEAAMVGHLTADLVLHIAAPELVRFGVLHL
jgi:membrane protease YdiL (CAAX protease family)